MIHDVFTIVAPVAPSRVDALRRLVNPAGDGRQPIPGLPLDRLPSLHFASIVVFDAQTVREVPGWIGRLVGRPERTLTTAPRLVFECCIDGSRDEFLDALVHAGGAALIAIFGHCLDFTVAPAAAPDPPALASLRAYLASHVRRPHLLHIGNPGLKADHIRAGHALRRALDARLDDLVRQRRSLDPPPFVAERLRAQLQVPPVAGAWHLADGPAPAWFDDPVPRWGARIRHWLRLIVVFGVPLALIAWGAWWLWRRYGLLALIAAFVAVRVAGRLAQRCFKGRHPPPTADPAHVRALKEMEDFSVQNHMASLVVLKPGWIRRLRQRWVLGSFELLYRTLFTDITPGRLRGLQTIHFAHWTVLDLLDAQGRPTGREGLLFLSNYDGSWETYLDDFIAFLLGGVVSIWSNGEGFPWPLDGPAFKAWARGCMSRWDYWYQAYPSLTVLNIENNDTVRRGLLATPRTDTEARQWLLRLGGAHVGDESLLPVPGTLETRDIQGIVLSGYRRLPHATYVLLRIHEAAAARAWLASIERYVTDGRSKRKEELELERFAINIACTHRGLARLGVAGEVLDAFPAAFQDGMAPAAGSHRSRALGDTGASDPARWRWGNSETPVDLLLMAYGVTRDSLTTDLAAHVDAFTQRAGVVVDRLDAAFLPTPPGVDDRLTIEHFGFADGVSQPILEGTPAALRQPLATSQHLIKPGEFVLGYPAGDGTIAPGVRVDARLDPHGLLPPLSPPGTNGAHGARDFGRNGSYLVFRQLEQDVAAFREFTGRASGANGPPYPSSSGARIAAQMVGRWRDGVPLTPRAASSRVAASGGANEFTFSSDAHGFACPIGSHVRRANPRDSLLADAASAQASANRHRLLRRGRPYGPALAPDATMEEAAASRGMAFVCLSGDIERQFEFVQQNWINNPCFGGLYEERDPLIGDQPSADDTASGQGGGHLTVQADAVRERLAGVGRYVTVRSGGYFFLPGLSALRYLAHLEPDGAVHAHAGAGATAPSGSDVPHAEVRVRAAATVPPPVQQPTIGYRVLTRLAAMLGTLRVVWLARFPLLLAAAIACYPILPLGVGWSRRPLALMIMRGWDLAIFSLVASLGAFVAMIGLRLVLLYDWRFDPPAAGAATSPSATGQRPRTGWTRPATWFQVLAYQAIALPAVLTSIHQAARGPSATQYWSIVFDLAPLALAGGLGAIAILLIATSIQALWRTARPDLFFPPNPLFANLAGPGLQGVRTSRVAQRLARLGGWIVDSVPEEIGRGYIDYRTRRVLPGHTFALIVAGLLVVLFEGATLWLQAHPSWQPLVVPHAWTLAWIVTRLWILSAVAFFLDRYRLSTILVAGAALWLFEYVVRPFLMG